MKTRSKNEYQLLQELTNVTIKTPVFTCKFNSAFEMDILCTNGIENLIAVKGDSLSDQFKLRQGQTFFDVFPFPEFKKVVSENIKKLPPQHNYINHIFHWDGKYDYNNPNSARTHIFKRFDDKYNFSNKQKSFYELMSIMESARFGKYKGLTIFGEDFSREYPDLDIGLIFLSGLGFNKGSDSDSEIQEWLISQNKTKVKESKSKVKESCSIVLESDTDNPDLLRDWAGYLESINCVEYNEKAKVNVFDIHVKVENVIEQETPKKEKEQVTAEKEQKEQTEKPDINTVLLMNIINQQQTKEKDQPKKEKIVKTIVCNQINKVYKSFDTLYLQKNDLFVLQSTLTRFKDKQEIFETLGIPYKLGILLHGLPGCGKSSVITAVASYLQRDIFYVDLSNVSTNEDLKDLFKHINKQQNKNGIIVMEDIDTMCEIVLRRTSVVNGTSADGKLTLDCLLNLLQGTLMEDGLIFIATTNHLEKLDPAFYRDGRFDVNINMKPCDNYQMQTIYQKFFKREIPEEYLAKLAERVITPSTFIHRLLPFVLVEKDDAEMLGVFLE